MSQTASLLRLRGILARRFVTDYAATLFILAPLILGTMLVLIDRIVTDLDISGAANPGGAYGLESACWAVAVLVALAAVRYRAVGTSTGTPADPLVTLPLSPFARGLDRYLSGWTRVLPVVVVMAAVAHGLGGGARRYFTLAALLCCMPLLTRGSRMRARRTRLGSTGVRRGISRLLAAGFPARYRALVARDLLLIGRGFSVRVWSHLALVAVAMLGVCERLVTAPETGVRAASLLAVFAAWACASLVSPLYHRQRAVMWVEGDGGVAAADYWRAKVAAGVVLGVLPGTLAALVWGVRAPLDVLWWIPVCAAVGGLVASALTEGDGEPLLNAAVTLILAGMSGALMLLFPWLMVLVPFISGYLGGLAVPRIAGRMEAAARRL